MENTRKYRYIRGIASLLFGCAICLFWGLYYPHHLHYHEQFQLFLFTPEYGIDKCLHPGGIAEYIAEFLTQFYYFAWAGATILAIVLVLIQRQINWLAKQMGASDFWYPLSFLPSILLWVFLCDENALLAFPVSITLALFALVIQRKTAHSWGRIIYTLLMMPVLYWVVGGGAYFIFVIGVAIGHCIKSVPATYNKSYIWIPIYILLGILCPLLAQNLTQYPLLSLMTGIDYYRFPMIVPNTLLVVIATVAITPGALALLPPPVKSTKAWMGIISTLLLIGGGTWIHAASNPDKEEAMKYDYLTRMKQWNKIIKAAENKEPNSPFSVTCLNLALAKTGQLGDRMFHFYQNGTEGLIPTFQRDFTSPLPTSEIFYHLGMINSSQRYMFEAMEAIPDYKKSGRAYMRLAETNLINGQYAVAAKYLRALQHTLFYKKWATNAMSYLNNDEKIEKHPEWGWLRKARYTEDFLFSDTEMDVMLGLLLQHNKSNRMAFEYMLAYVLQKKDLERFMKYYPLGKDLGYNHIPISYQEALIFIWTQQHPNFQGLPWSISRNVLEGVSEFARVYMTQKDSEPILRPKYEKTFWYYLLFRK